VAEEGGLENKALDDEAFEDDLEQIDGLVD
jgi:hypothetical protein